MQKLWLFSNKIAKLENLSALGDLREFWVQDNKITKLAGLENVSSLQILAVAANRLSGFKDLQKLAVLPNLRDLSSDDAKRYRLVPQVPQEKAAPVSSASATQFSRTATPGGRAARRWAPCPLCHGPRSLLANKTSLARRAGNRAPTSVAKQNTARARQWKT